MAENRIPTTFEMDGLFSQEDIDNRHKVMKQCTRCSKWTQQNTEREDIPCTNCGAIAFDIQSTKSLRTFNPLTDNKRKIKK
jgi:rRNA maturation endonuclease Nob1